MFELSVACEVFGLDRSELVDPWYRHRVAAAVPGPHTSPEGLLLETPYGLDEIERADTVVIPARIFAGDPPAEVLSALRAAHARGARMLSMGPRWPMRSPAAWSCRPTGTAGRRSSSTCPGQKPARTTLWPTCWAGGSSTATRT